MHEFTICWASLLLPHTQHDLLLFSSPLPTYQAYAHARLLSPLPTAYELASQQRSHGRFPACFLPASLAFAGVSPQVPLYPTLLIAYIKRRQCMRPDIHTHTPSFPLRLLCLPSSSPASEHTREARSLLIANTFLCQIPAGVTTGR